MTTSELISNGTKKQAPASARLALGLIKAYRRTLSPLLAYIISCRHDPSCSQYGLEAISRYGAWRGGWMTMKRILRCNPLFPGGFDPVR